MNDILLYDLKNSILNEISKGTCEDTELTILWYLGDVLLTLSLDLHETTIFVDYGKLSNKYRNITHWHTDNSDIIEEIKTINDPNNILKVFSFAGFATSKIISKEKAEKERTKKKFFTYYGI